MSLLQKLLMHGLLCLSMQFHPVIAAPTIQAGFSPEGSALILVIQTIERAQHSISLMGYSYTSPEITKALVKAHKRGVTVRIILDEKANRNQSSRSAINLLVNAGIPLRTNNNFAIMHDKVMVVDSSTLQTGSFNYTRAGARKNSENVLVIHGIPELAQTYLKHWQSRWDTGKDWKSSY